MRKKVIALIASVAMVVTMIPSAAFAAEETKGEHCNGGSDCTHEVEAKLTHNGEVLHYDKLEDVVGVQYADIKLLRNIELDDTLELNAGINLDLNRCSISSSAKFPEKETLLKIQAPNSVQSVYIYNGKIECNLKSACVIESSGFEVYMENVDIVGGKILIHDGSNSISGNINLTTEKNNHALCVETGGLNIEGSLKIVSNYPALFIGKGRTEDGDKAGLSVKGDVDINTRDGKIEAIVLNNGGVDFSGKVNILGVITTTSFGGSISFSEGSNVTVEATQLYGTDDIVLDNGTITNAGTLNADIHLYDPVFLKNEGTGIINGVVSGKTENIKNEPGGVINHDHNFGNWIIVIKPTDSMIGLHYRECYGGEREYAFIPATGSATIPGGNTGGSSGASGGSGAGGGSGTGSGNATDSKLEAVPGADNAVRVSGDTRFETATNVADQLKEIYGVEKFDNIVVTYSDVFADAMSASALAADKEAPILVVNKNNESYVKNYIAKNLEKNGNVYIIGGTGVVSERFEDSLDDYKVKRISGKDRYETNLEVLKELNLSGSQEIMIASGAGFADALSASATGNAIMLVGDKLTAEQEAFIKSLNSGDEYFVVGGTGSVNTSVYNQIKNAGSGDVTRIYGSTRYETSAAIAEEFFGKAKSVFVASGDDFPDGLTGGVLANATGAPLLLANEKNTSQAEDFVVGNKARMVTAVGGTKALSDKAIGKIA